MIEIKNLTKTYIGSNKEKVEALKGVSFNFPSKGMVFIVGESGSGKSTLLNVLGLLDSFDDGEFLFDGKSVKDLTDKERDEIRAEKIGFVFQEFHIIEKYSLGQNVSLPLEITKEKTTRQETEEILETVGLSGYYNRRSSQISGGQRQRVAIARAIVKNPKIVLADEPTGNLDSDNSRKIFDLLKKLSEDRLVVVISHDAENAERYADEIIILKDGLINDIREGEGNLKIVKLTEGEFKPKDITKLLAENKKVVILPKREKPIDKEVKQEVITDEVKEDKNKKMKLPFKSSVRLSWLGIKAKWLRTLITIFISMFALAFFGFSDIIGQFGIEHILRQEVLKAPYNFVAVGAQSVQEEDSLFVYYNDEYIDAELQAKFDSFGLDYINQYASNAIPISLPSNPGVSILGSSYFSSFIECNDLDTLGLELFYGDFPENNNQVLISRYVYEQYLSVGFRDRKTNTTIRISEPQDIIGKELSSPVLMIGNTGRKYYEIVGIIDVDLTVRDKLIELRANREDTEEFKQEIRSVWTEFNAMHNLIYGALFVNEGFYDEFLIDYCATNIYNVEMNFNGGEMAGVQSKIYNFQTFNIPDRASTDFTGELRDDEVILSLSSIWRHVVDDEDYDDFRLMLINLKPNEMDKIIEWLDDMIIKYDLFNSKVALQTNGLDNTKEFKITGITFDYLDNYILVPSSYTSIFKTKDIANFLVPAVTNREKTDLTNLITESEIFKIGEESFRFVVLTPHSKEIYYVGTLFKLFVQVFGLLAVVFCVFSLILTYSFVQNSISSRSKDIGILRSLGISKGGIAKIFIFEGLIIAILEAIFATLLCWIGYELLNTYFISQIGYLAKNYNVISFTFRQAALICSSAFVFVGLSIILPVVRISKKQPIDAIRNS